MPPESSRTLAGSGSLSADLVAESGSLSADLVAEPTATPANAPVTAAAKGPGSEGAQASSEIGVPASDPGSASVGPGRGVLVLPPAANSHRVYVDGRLAGVPPPPIVVGCGKHLVKVGLQGREQSVIVPCGGSVTIAYP